MDDGSVYLAFRRALNAAFPPKVRRLAEQKARGRPKKSAESVRGTLERATFDWHVADYRKNGSAVWWIAKRLGTSESVIDRHLKDIKRRAAVMDYLRRRRVRAYLQYRKSRQLNPPI